MQEMQLQSLGRKDPLEKESGNPLQYSCLGNPMGRGAWWAIVHGVAKHSDMTQHLNNNKKTSARLKVELPVKREERTRAGDLCLLNHLHLKCHLPFPQAAARMN